MEIVGTTLAEVWEKSIREIIKSNAQLVPTQHDMITKELQNVVLVVSKPFSKPRISEKYSFPEEFRDNYSEQIFEQYNKSEDILYTRLYEYGDSKLNQIEKCIEILKENWYSRRAVINFWDPEIDLDSEFPPSFFFIQFMIRESKLDCTSTIRGNDAWLCAPLDMLALTNLQKTVADSLGLECGKYMHHVNSYHIYEYDYPTAMKVFSYD